MSPLDIDFITEPTDDGFVKLGWRATIGNDKLGNSVLLKVADSEDLPGPGSDVAKIVVFNAADSIARLVLGEWIPVIPEEPSLLDVLTAEGHFHQRQLIATWAEAQLKDKGWTPAAV